MTGLKEGRVEYTINLGNIRTLSRQILQGFRTKIEKEVVFGIME